ncbi:MAG: FimB/Mfa2 family fimbrial subunit [Bacteroidaceae bacterium]|nr:FimB/Mfa2 family fimbrial subunit [Bacteroidaceae bacterium]
MKNVLGKLLLSLVVACGILACEKSELGQESTEVIQKEANSTLQVRTRATPVGGETTVSYPVNVYVFSGDKCVALQTISDETQMLNISLTEGSYAVYAIGGATPANYILPSKENATSAMAIALQEGKGHADLMVAKSDVVLADREMNVLTLSMQRKVMLLQSVVLKNIPSVTTAVSVTLSPLWKKLEGVSYKEESGTETMALTKQADGRTWSLSESCYLLPPSDNSTAIMVNVVTPTGSTSYTYNILEQLEAGDIINIQGKYTEAVGVTLTGMIDGAAWNMEKTISFDFNEQGTQTSDDEEEETPSVPTDYILVDNIPVAGSLYQGCYVLSVTENNGVSEVLLLSSKQKTMGFANGTDAETAMNEIEAAMPECSVNGIDGWRLMTNDEIEIVRKNKSKISQLDTNVRYLYVNSSGVLRVGKFATTQVSEGWTFNSTDILRPVTIVKMKKQ